MELQNELLQQNQPKKVKKEVKKQIDNYDQLYNQYVELKFIHLKINEQNNLMKDKHLQKMFELEKICKEQEGLKSSVTDTYSLGFGEIVRFVKGVTIPNSLVEKIKNTKLNIEKIIE